MGKRSGGGGCSSEVGARGVRATMQGTLGRARGDQAMPCGVEKAKEALAEETRVAPKKAKKAIAEYKESRGFQLGL
ncbi:hypothetical protein B296_00003127 [Ensete ventricosum]|uniref:Uncharacterized protein n=1 Tax=Ensete ventricosum TaxID=4639 RepID=A0A426ZLI8_ENSVE|nr:hypothetical protein B296_00003127 [Ensete ventricosum]